MYMRLSPLTNRLIHQMTTFSCFSFTPSCTDNVNYDHPHDSPLFNKLHSCKSTSELKQIHTLLIKRRPPLQTQQALYRKIISLCASSPPLTDLSYIYSIFIQLVNPDISVYNEVIKCFSSSRNKTHSLISLLLYRNLIENGLVGDSYTYTFVLKACTQLLALRAGQMVHANVIKNGFVFDLYVANALMRLYGVCRRVVDARKLFDGSPDRDLVSWTVLIQGYVDNGSCAEGVEVFFDMCGAGVKADEKMMTVVISACAKLGDLSLGKRLHEYIRDRGIYVDVFVGNALMDMYLKCGDSESAHVVFNKMPVRNVISWNSMISGLAQSGDYKKVLSMFKSMKKQGFELDEITLVGALNSCANLRALELGKWIHAYIDRNKILMEGHVGNSLIDMYAKCGSIDDALRVFSGIESRDVYTYSAVIMGLAMHGRGEMALKLFYEMCRIGVEPNDVTFIGVLTACCHSGFVNEGHKHFADMSRLYNIKPKIEHYGCMVDLLGRAGLINEAYEFVNNMLIEPDKLVWGSLLGACRIHGELELAERITKKLVEVEPDKDGSYVLLSNIYASEMKWENVKQIRRGMRQGKIVKSPGCSSIELENVVHEFRKGDKSHPRGREIYMLLNTMTHHLYDDSERMIIDYEFFW